VAHREPCCRRKPGVIVSGEKILISVLVVLNEFLSG
jgi:hypothetical protein